VGTLVSEICSLRYHGEKPNQTKSIQTEPNRTNKTSKLQIEQKSRNNFVNM